jgi:hypothetical protein
MRTLQRVKNQVLQVTFIIALLLAISLLQLNKSVEFVIT